MNPLSALGANSALPWWPPDWSQFWPDLTIAVLVGVGLALFVLRLEMRAAARRERREAEVQWLLVRPRVSASLGQRYSDVLVTYWEESFGSLSDIAARFRKLAKRYPFGAWAEAAPKCREISLVSNAAQALFEFDEAARFLEPAIFQHFLLTDAGGDSVVLSEQVTFSRYFVMRDSGLDWLRVPKDDDGSMRARHDELTREIGDAISRFQTARQAFEKAWTEARDAVRGRWGDDLRSDI